MVELIERLRNSNQMSCEHIGFQFRCGVHNLGRECFQQFADIQGCFVIQFAEIDVFRCEIRCFFQDAACTCMSILYVRTCFAVEVQHTFPREHNVFDTGVVQVVENNGAAEKDSFLR